MTKKTLKMKCRELFKKERIIIGLFAGVYALFIFLSVSPLYLIPTDFLQNIYTDYVTYIIILLLISMLLTSYLLARYIVESGIILKESRPLTTLGITLIITGIATTLFVMFLNASINIYTISKTLNSPYLKYLNTTYTISVPQEIQNIFLQVSLNFLLGGIGLIGVALPILLSSTKGECCCKTERPSQHTECNISEKESEGEKGGSLS